MKKYLYMICALAAVSLVSCDDYLDVRPKSEKLEADQFSTPQGFEDAIYGVYGALSSPALYGEDLLWGITDILAQDIDCSSTEGDAIAKYDYENDYLKSRFKSIWSSAYQVIGYANNVLDELGKKSPEELPLYNYYKGEMLAARALLHFDLIRLFTPTNQSAKGIPYVKAYSIEVSPFVSVGEGLKNVIEDFKAAEQLLADEASAIKYPHDNTNYYAFLNYRETHLNYYAVKALLARVYWYMGDMANAATYAEDVINSGAFPLVEVAEVQDYLTGVLSPKETLFGIYSKDYETTCKNLLYQFLSFVSYNPYTNESGQTWLLPWDGLYNLDVDGSAQDYRRLHFKQNVGTCCCWKVVDYFTLGSVTRPASTYPVIKGMTIIHSSELYLIAAEANLASNYSKALELFNTEIQSRGLSPLSSEVKLTEERIFNEFHKELFCEGQVWFNMKRRNMDITSNAELRTIPASDDYYVIPIPEDEFNYRY